MKFPSFTFLACSLGLVGTALPAISAECLDHTKRDPSSGPFFVTEVPNALDPTFKYDIPSNGRVTVNIGEGMHDAGFVDQKAAGATTKIYGYYQDGDPPTWPGKTFEVFKAKPITVTWVNNIGPKPYILTGSRVDEDHDYSLLSVVDESLHWAYGLEDFQDITPPVTIDSHGVPIVTHLHGGHSDAEFDGNPDFFYNKDGTALGPYFQTNEYVYQNNFYPTAIWYHDHALGITRLNVYAGLAGFYILRDNSDSGEDTGHRGNSLKLPTGKYEVALAIQDRMFKKCGELLYPAFPGEPAYSDFIEDEEADLSTFENGGPTALAEFFGDHMVVNGKVWPKMAVEPRNYRLRVLNGCDSRFLVLSFVVVNDVSELDPSGEQMDFFVIGTDQGFKITGDVESRNRLVVAPGERYDIIINFSGLEDKRIIMKNSGGDEPFGGLNEDGSELATSTETSRVMAFDVTESLSAGYDATSEFDLANFNKWLPRGNAHPPVLGQVSRVRKVGLFEGLDEFGRLQPVLGTIEPAVDYMGNPIEWPAEYATSGLVGPIQGGTIGWHTEPASENPDLNDVEEWEIWNLSGDAHPVHLHLVTFEVIGRYDLADPYTTDDFLQGRDLIQHTGAVGTGFNVIFPNNCDTDIPQSCYDSAPVVTDDAFVDEEYPKDLVTALPGQVTKIRVKFTKPGRYVWHCHILSHEDHEMMRVLHVGPNPEAQSRKKNLRN